MEDLAWPRDVTLYAMGLWGRHLPTVEPYPLVALSSTPGTMGQDHDNVGMLLLLQTVLDLATNKQLWPPEPTPDAILSPTGQNPI